MSGNEKPSRQKKSRIPQEKSTPDSIVKQPPQEFFDQNLRQLCEQVSKEIAVLIQGWHGVEIPYGIDTKVQCPFCPQKHRGILQLISIMPIPEKSEQPTNREYTFKCSVCQRRLVYRD